MSEFETLVDAHYEALYRFGMSLSKSADTAADLVQQTFCIWAQKGHQLKERDKAKTWLFTTLHREFLAYARKSKRYSDEELTEAVAGRICSEDDDTERLMDGQRVLELLGELDENFRSPLALFYLQQHSYKEIAEILDVPIGTVMSRISRAKEMLRRRMTAEPSTAPKNILQLQPEALKSHHG
ncbi:RNA polymerase sigma factor [Luteolibacter sp. Populi]|uniref:RNA polymerase sigma factor n=1 Tax=Luteolibacter sp. Populi TaxID=3230487 RepID=UPI003465DFB6